MKNALILLAAVTVVAVVIELLRRRRLSAPTDLSPRARQETAGGKPVVEEWGEESFPASDPPQSW